MSDFQNPISDAELESRVTDLLDEDPKVRQSAIEWLADNSVLEAIEDIAVFYESDPDKRVKQAAGDALRRFKALEVEYQQSIESGIPFIIRGQQGAGRQKSARGLYMLQFLLLITAIALFAGGVMLGGDDEGETDENGTQAVAASTGNIAADTSFMAQRLRNSAAALQVQFQNLQNGGALDCETTVDLPPLYALAADTAGQMPDVAKAVESLNSFQADINTVKVTFDNACRGLVILTPEAVTEPLNLVTNVLSQLPAVEQSLIEGLATPIPEPTATPTLDLPTAEPSPTLPGANVSLHRSELLIRVDNVRALRGAYTMLNNFWSEAQAAGVTDGCREPVPEIPDNYILPPAAVQESLDLQRAANDINVGLDLLRQGWSNFTQACLTSNLIGAADQGLRDTAQALQLFETGLQKLDAVRN